MNAICVNDEGGALDAPFQDVSQRHLAPDPVGLGYSVIRVDEEGERQRELRPELDV